MDSFDIVDDSLQENSFQESFIKHKISDTIVEDSFDESSTCERNNSMQYNRRKSSNKFVTGNCTMLPQTSEASNATSEEDRILIEIAKLESLNMNSDGAECNYKQMNTSEYRDTLPSDDDDDDDSDEDICVKAARRRIILSESEDEITSVSHGHSEEKLDSLEGNDIHTNTASGNSKLHSERKYEEMQKLIRKSIEMDTVSVSETPKILNDSSSSERRRIIENLQNSVSEKLNTKNNLAMLDDSDSGKCQAEIKLQNSASDKVNTKNNLAIVLNDSDSEKGQAGNNVPYEIKVDLSLETPIETIDIIDLSSDVEETLKENNVNASNNIKKDVKDDMKNKLPDIFRKSPINVLPKQIKTEVDDKHYCTTTEYSNQATKVANLRTDALKCKNALRTVNLNSLPDKGALLQQKQRNLEKQLLAEEQLLNRMVVTNPVSAPEGAKKLTWDQLVANSNCVVPKTLGKQAMNTYSTQKTLTMDRLKSLHDSLKTCPDEKAIAKNPEGLKIELMDHQKRALTWLMWREGQKPAGGILADDMGLGKTLTMISLILQTNKVELKANSSDSESEKEEEDQKWKSKFKNIKPEGGTLVICPATLIGQWENEINKRVKRNLLIAELYHGTKRDTKVSRLAKYDVVITTYKLVQGEYERKGPLFNIKWKRIILDEAHVVRNHKSQTSVAVCGLRSKTRWALTGTPVHNKELDLYALLKFLRCSPFDDLFVWKQWVANKNAGGQDRLNTVMTSILLRRTKAQLQNEGVLIGLPDRKFEEINVKLDSEEQQVYQKVLLFSRSLFIEFLRQRELKNPDLFYKKGSTACTDAKTDNEQYNKMHQKILDMYGGSTIKSHQILVLLLRLRQICCHTSLIHSMLDQDNCQSEGIEEDGVDIDLFDKFSKLNLDNEVDSKTQNEPQVEDLNVATSKLLSSSNPVFKKDRENEKLRVIRKLITEKVLPEGDKIIIVSQWTSMLHIILQHLKKYKIECDILDGSVPVHKRNVLVTNFNDPTNKVKVLLLSLTAGGVGLNLVGANHLLLVDLHWNPQLESQAQDRIYRVGQTKTVHVYKIVTSETIEERIKALQDSKLSMASDILAGTRAAGASKLSMEDLKMLFNVGAK